MPRRDIIIATRPTHSTEGEREGGRTKSEQKKDSLLLSLSVSVSVNNGYC